MRFQIYSSIGRWKVMPDAQESNGLDDPFDVFFVLVAAFIIVHVAYAIAGLKRLFRRAVEVTHD